LGKFKACLGIEQNPRALTTDIRGRKQKYPMRVHFHLAWFALANIRALKVLSNQDNGAGAFISRS
jgi:hypothetical protein